MAHLPLTQLSEEEEIFRGAVRDFAEEKLRPLALEMDRENQLRPEVIPWLFEMGLMGIEIPEEFGGAGAEFFMSILAIEELARVDPAVAVVCDVQNTLFINAIKRWANPPLAERIFGALTTGTVGAYALSEAGAGSDAFALQCRAREEGDAYHLTEEYSMMLRTKFPGGSLTAEQYLICDDLSAKLGNNDLRCTSRQCFQFRGVLKGNLRELINSLNTLAKITSVGACGARPSLKLPLAKPDALKKLSETSR